MVRRKRRTIRPALRATPQAAFRRSPGARNRPASAIFVRNFMRAEEMWATYAQAAFRAELSESRAGSSARRRASARSRTWLRWWSSRRAETRRDSGARRPASPLRSQRACLPHGGADAAAARGDLGVGGAFGALVEFIRAVAGEDRVRVRVHEAGQHDAAAGVDHFRIRRSRALDFRARSDFQRCGRRAPAARRSGRYANSRISAPVRARAGPARVTTWLQLTMARSGMAIVGRTPGPRGTPSSRARDAGNSR
jgi:hypothetical protein